MSLTWVKCYRSMMDSAIWQDDWLVRLWLWCLFKANHRDSSFRGQVILRGQFVTGRNTAADELRVSPSKWYRGIERLEELGCIKVEANKHWTTVTVCNYCTYQDGTASERTTDEQPADNQRTQSKNDIIHNSELREDGHSPKQQKTAKPKFVPPTTEEVAAYCKERGNKIDAAKFVDYYASKGWLVGKSPMKDWRAGVRTWEKNSFQGNGNGQHGYQSPPMRDLELDTAAIDKIKAYERELRQREAVK